MPTRPLMASTDSRPRVDSRTVHGIAEGARPGLATIRRTVDRLLGSDLTAAQREALDLIEGTVLDLQTLLQDVEDLAAIDDGSLTLGSQEFDLHSLVRETIRQARPQAGVRGLEIGLTGVRTIPSQVKGDAGRLRQVLSHLLGNAIQSTMAGGVGLTTSMVGESEEEAIVRFEIRDTGVGIGVEDLARVFEPFEKAGFAGRGGAGLGLTISRRLVEAMGGEMVVESSSGTGSVFAFNLPLAKTAAPRVAEDVPSGPAWVLVISDQAGSGDAVSAILAGQGHVPTLHPDADLAAGSLRRSETEKPDSIVIAHSRPFEIAERVVHDATLRETPVLLISPDGLRGEGETCARLGVQGYLAQPISPIDLSEALALIRSGGTGTLVNRHLLRERRRRLNLMLVESSPGRRATFLRLMEPLGHQVAVCSNAGDALVEITKGGVDTVVVGAELVDTDALTLARAVRRWEAGAGSRTRLVATVPIGSDDDVRRYRAAGFDAVQTKNASTLDLYSALFDPITPQNPFTVAG